MTGKTHAAVGICAASFLLVPKTDFKTAILGLGFCIIGSYATDSDLTVSKAGHVITDVVYGIAALTLIYLILIFKLHYNVLSAFNKENVMISGNNLIGAILIIGSIVVGRITGHRKYMHSLLGFFIMNTGVWLIAPKFVVWFGLGYLLHMLVDLLNEKPEALLFPLKKGRLCFSICKSKGTVNWLISTIAYICFMYNIVSIYGLQYLNKIFY